MIPIYVPPLRERKDDIPLLVRHFMDLFSRENNFRPKRITPAAHGRAAALPLEGQHPRAAEHRGAPDHHDARRRIDLADLPESLRVDGRVARAG